MKTLLIVMVLLVSIPAAAQRFNGAWAQRNGDLELLIRPISRDEVRAVLKTNSTCKPIFAKMAGQTLPNIIILRSEPIRIPNSCWLTLSIFMSVKFQKDEMSVVVGDITSETQCGSQLHREMDLLDGKIFYRTNPKNFFEKRGK